MEEVLSSKDGISINNYPRDFFDFQAKNLQTMRNSIGNLRKKNISKEDESSFAPKYSSPVNFDSSAYRLDIAQQNFLLSSLPSFSTEIPSAENNLSLDNFSLNSSNSNPLQKINIKNFQNQISNLNKPPKKQLTYNQLGQIDSFMQPSL